MRIDNVNSLQLFQIFRYGANVLINILLAKILIDLSEIAVFETLIFLASAATFFVVPGVCDALLSSYHKQVEKNKGTWIFDAIVLLSLISIVCALVLLLAEGQIMSFFDESNLSAEYKLLCIFVLLITPTYLSEYILLLRDKFQEIVYFGILTSIIRILCVIVPLLLGYDLYVSFLALIGYSILRLIYLSSLAVRFAELSINNAAIRKMAIFAAPIALYTLLGSVGHYIDGVLIQRLDTAENFTIFRYGARELPLALAMAASFHAALLPSVSVNFKSALSEMKQKSTRLMHILFPISIALMFMTYYIFPIVFSEKFQASYLIFNIYLLLLVSRLIFPQTLLIGLNKPRVYVVVGVIELIINVALSLLLYERWGIAGVAFATVIAYVFEKVALVSYNYFALDIKPGEYIDFKWQGIYSTALIGAFVACLYIYPV